MNRLSAFLHPVRETEEKDIIISDRFVDENGDPIPFKIRALKQEENDAIVKRCRKTKKGMNGQIQEYLDSTEMARQIVVAATVEPDFRSAELCEHFQVADPAMVPGKMLLAGEFTKLAQAITDLSGFSEDLEQEAKN